MIIVLAIIVGVILIKILPAFHNVNTTIKISQVSDIKENYIKDVIVDFQNVQRNNDNKDLNLLSDAKNINNNFQYNNDINKQETANYQLEKLNSNNDDVNKQETVNFQLEKSNSNNVNTNKQEITNSQLEKLNSNNDNANKQEIASSQLENPNNNNIDTINQETINSQLEKSNGNNNDANKQEIASSQLEKPNNNNDTNNQETISSKLEETNSNVNTENQGSENADLEIKIPTIHYDRTTSIYANDNITLLRIEYYVNNKLTYYSVIEQFDATTKSYIEKIYQCNRETNIDSLIRTDVYDNGNLIKSY